MESVSIRHYVIERTAKNEILMNFAPTSRARLRLSSLRLPAAEFGSGKRTNARAIRPGLGCCIAALADHRTRARSLVSHIHAKFSGLRTIRPFQRQPLPTPLSAVAASVTLCFYASYDINNSYQKPFFLRCVLL